MAGTRRVEVIGSYIHDADKAQLKKSENFSIDYTLLIDTEHRGKDDPDYKYKNVPLHFVQVHGFQATILI